MTRVGALLVCTILAVTVLAGCANDGADDPSPGTETEGALTKGVLRGLVVDDRIRPLADAVVSIRKDGHAVVEVATDADGNFGVPNLDAGDYIVNASKPGFLGNELPATVVGGDNLPPLVQLQLAPAPVDTAFVWPLLWKGQVACGSTFQAWCAAFNLATGIEVFEDESFRFLFDDFMAYQRTPDFLQVEIVWEPNTPLSHYAYGAFWASTWAEWEECLCTPNILALEGGDSYILAQVTGDLLQEFDVGFTTGIGVGFSAGQGFLADAVPPPSPERVSVMVNQPFEAFFHVFYGCLPEEGWRFTEHGDPTCDPKSLKATETA